MFQYLIVTNHSYMLYRFRKELIEELLKKGRVTVCTPYTGHEKDLMRMGCTCINTPLERRGMNPVKDVRLIGLYREILTKVQPDAVITYSIKPNIYCGWLCQMMNIPYFTNVQGLGTAFQSVKTAVLVAAMYKTACRDAVKVFFENRGNMEVFLKHGLVTKEQAVVNPGAGVNLVQYPFMEYPSEKDGIRFLYLGRIMKEKGVGELLDAFSRLRERHDNIFLDVVGFFEDDMEPAFREKMRQDGIRFHGFTEDPLPYYKNCHCVILPSYHEGMSNVLLEAASCGRPLIVSSIFGCREVVYHETNGFLCREKDTEDLEECMEYFLRRTEDEHRRMGALSRKRAEDVFDKDKVVSAVMKEIAVVC